MSAASTGHSSALRIKLAAQQAQSFRVNTRSPRTSAIGTQLALAADEGPIKVVCTLILEPEISVQLQIASGAPLAAEAQGVGSMGEALAARRRRISDTRQ